MGETRKTARWTATSASCARRDEAEAGVPQLPASVRGSATGSCPREAAGGTGLGRRIIRTVAQPLTVLCVHALVFVLSFAGLQTGRLLLARLLHR